MAVGTIATGVRTPILFPGGGGQPPGVVFTVSTWIDLFDLPADNDTLALVFDHGFNGFGIARYDLANTNWFLTVGQFGSLTDLLAFNNQIDQGAWGFIPSGGEMTSYLYDEIVRNAAAGGGTRFDWYPSAILETFGAEVQAHFTGTETLPVQWNATGWTETLTGSGQILQVTDAGGNFLQCTDNGVGSSTATLSVTSLAGTMNQFTRWYFRARVRVPLATGFPVVVQTCDGQATPSRGNTLACSSTSLFWGTNASPPVSISTLSLRGGGTALPTTGTGEWIEVFGEGTNVLDTCYRGSDPYSGNRAIIGNFATAAAFLRIGDVYSGLTGAQIDFSQALVVTW
jgi:hypothetical protein